MVSEPQYKFIIDKNLVSVIDIVKVEVFWSSLLPLTTSQKCFMLLCQTQVVQLVE